MEIEYRKSMAANGRLIIAMMFAMGLVDGNKAFCMACIATICAAYVSDAFAAVDKQAAAAVVALLTVASTVALMISLVFM